MFKRITFACLTISVMMVFSSCGSSRRSLIPQAVNMVKAVSFEELNLTGKDYVILDRIESTARIEVTISSNVFIVKDPDGTFLLSFVKDKNTNDWVLQKFEGVVHAGYLLGRDNSTSMRFDSPDEVAHRIATYRIINLVKEQGGDGIIEPVITTNMEGEKSRFGTTTVTYVTTVSGKVVRLKTTK